SVPPPDGGTCHEAQRACPRAPPARTPPTRRYPALSCADVVETRTRHYSPRSRASGRCARRPHRECQDPRVEAELVSRAIAAATAVVGGQGLSVHDVVVVQNSNKLALRLLPCDVFARVAPVGDEAFALEVELAQRLAAIE